MSDPVNTDTLRELATHWGFDWQAPLIFAAADEIDRLRDGIRKRHRNHPLNPDVCETCQTSWPCATRKSVDGE